MQTSIVTAVSCMPDVQCLPSKYDHPPDVRQLLRDNIISNLRGAIRVDPTLAINKKFKTIIAHTVIDDGSDPCCPVMSVHTILNDEPLALENLPCIGKNKLKLMQLLVHVQLKESQNMCS